MCLEDKKLIDAHIIPKSFFKSIKIDNQPLEIHTNKKGEYTKRSHAGIYDKTILCGDCETLFQRYDDYAQSLLLPDAKEEDYILGPDGKRVGYILKNIDYCNLKLFFLSVLWRASVSTREEFSKIDVGPFEKALRLMMQSDDPGDENVFSVIVNRFDDYLGKKFLIDPHNERFDDGINFCRFYLGAGYRVFIKVDKRSLPESNIFRFFILKTNQPLCVTINDLRTSEQELSVLKSTIGKN